MVWAQQLILILIFVIDINIDIDIDICNPVTLKLIFLVGNNGLTTYIWSQQASCATINALKKRTFLSWEEKRLFEKGCYNI